MKNVEMTAEGTMLTIRVDLSTELGGGQCDDSESGRKGWAQRLPKEVVTESDLHTNVMPAFYLGIRF